MLLNVAAPHVPLAIWYAGYTPGLLTAVAVNLPFLPMLLARARSERYVAPNKAIAFSVAAAIGGIVLVTLLSFLSRL
jgi:hypothetical protein